MSEFSVDLHSSETTNPFQPRASLISRDRVATDECSTLVPMQNFYGANDCFIKTDCHDRPICASAAIGPPPPLNCYRFDCATLEPFITDAVPISTRHSFVVPSQTITSPPMTRFSAEPRGSSRWTRDRASNNMKDFRMINITESEDVYSKVRIFFKTNSMYSYYYRLLCLPSGLRRSRRLQTKK